jgi:hypothetical protein
VFLFRGKELSYAVNEGERAVEIPIVAEWYGDLKEPWDIVEVGAVTPYWYDPNVPYRRALKVLPNADAAIVPHRVLDPYDPYIKAERVDAVGFDFTGLTVLSISTLEHIGVDESHYGGSGAQKHRPEEAAETLHSIIVNSSHYCLTWPVGFNRELDKAAQKSNAPRIMLHQLAPKVYEVGKENWDKQYGSPYSYANAVVVMSDWLERCF